MEPDGLDQVGPKAETTVMSNRHSVSRGVCAVLAVAPSAPAIVAATAPDSGTVRYVTDGDTFWLESGERIRIAGIDAPETHRDQAKCATEVTRGNAASARARTLLDHRDATFVQVCRSYNRTIARVTLDGRDVAAELVSLGVARWWPRGKPKPD